MAVSVAPASALVTTTRAAGVPDRDTARPAVTNRALSDRTRIRSSLNLMGLARLTPQRPPAFTESGNPHGPEADHPVRLHRRPAGRPGVGAQIQRIHEERAAAQHAIGAGCRPGRGFPPGTPRRNPPGTPP